MFPPLAFLGKKLTKEARHVTPAVRSCRDLPTEIYLVEIGRNLVDLVNRDPGVIASCSGTRLAFVPTLEHRLLVPRAEEAGRAVPIAPRDAAEHSHLPGIS